MKVDALRELEPDFWRAPSAHNTQPWVLRYPSRDGDPVEVGWEPARALPVADPTGRDLRLGLGAFVECCLVVCAAAGLSVAFEPSWDESELRAGWLVAAEEPYRTPYTVADVRGRRSARVPYAAEPLPPDLVAELRSLAEADDAELRILTDEPPGAEPGQSASAAGPGSATAPDGTSGEPPAAHLFGKIAGLLREADRHQYGAPAVVAELRSWLRLTPRHPRYDSDGLTDRALALTRPEALGLRTVLSPALYPVLRPLGLPRLLAAASGAPPGGALLVLIAPPGTGPIGQLTLGRTLLRLWLTLTREGLAAHPLSQLIDTPTTRTALATHLDVDDPTRLLHITRAGRPLSTVPTSARVVS